MCLAETGQLQILFTFFVTMVLQQNMLGVSWDLTLGFALTFFNLTIIGLTCYFELINYREMVKEEEIKAATRRAEEEAKRVQKRVEFALKAGKSLDNDQSSQKPQFQKVESIVLTKTIVENDSDDEDEEDPDQGKGNKSVGKTMTKNILHSSKAATTSSSAAIELNILKSPIGFLQKSNSKMRRNHESDSDDED
jgi:hypothetical protein